MKLTITELKDILRELDMTVSGQKNELVQQIMQLQNDLTVLRSDRREDKPDRQEEIEDEHNASEEDEE